MCYYQLPSDSKIWSLFTVRLQQSRCLCVNQTFHLFIIPYYVNVKNFVFLVTLRLHKCIKGTFSWIDFTHVENIYNLKCIRTRWSQNTSGRLFVSWSISICVYTNSYTQTFEHIRTCFWYAFVSVCVCSYKIKCQCNILWALTIINPIRCYVRVLTSIENETYATIVWHLCHCTLCNVLISCKVSMLLLQIRHVKYEKQCKS